MSDNQLNINESEDDEPVSADSVSDPGEEPEDGVFEAEKEIHPGKDLPSLSGEAEIKPRTDYPPDDRY